MSKLVKQGRHFVESQKRGLGWRWLGEVTNNGYMWSLFPSCILLLSSEACHPCTVSLSRTGKKVGVEYRHMFIGLVLHLISHDIWMIHRNILVGYKGQVE